MLMKVLTAKKKHYSRKRFNVFLRLFKSLSLRQKHHTHSGMVFLLRSEENVKQLYETQLSIACCTGQSNLLFSFQVFVFFSFLCYNPPRSDTYDEKSDFL